MSEYECDNCGDKTPSTLGGECIYKCSEVVEKDKLQELVQEWRDKQEQLTLPVSGITGEGMAFKKCADALEEAITINTD